MRHWVSIGLLGALVVAFLMTVFGCAARASDNDTDARSSLHGVVDSASALRIEGWLAAAQAAGRHRVVLEINSPGGHVSAAYRIARAIEDADHAGLVVACVAEEEAMSAAFFILQSCPERYMTKRTVLMTHSPWAAVEVTVDDGDNIQQENLRSAIGALALAFAEHCSFRLNISIDDYLVKIGKGRAWFMAHREAVAVGAVDHVVHSVEQVPL